MKRYGTILSWIVMILLFYPATGQCLNVDLRGHVSSLYILRDTDGFQNTFMDNLYGVQWRNELQFDLTLKPEYRGAPTYYLEKIFMSYRGAYDAIFELTDRYDAVRIKSPRDHELGKDDIEWENDLRELFVDLVAEEGMQRINLRLGRQIVRWGETDSFNVINVPNPEDRSFQMFFSDPDDLATPLWMGRLDYNVTGAGIFDNIGLEVLAIPEIMPTLMAPLGDENDVFNTDAPYAFTFKGFEKFPGINRIREDVPEENWENMEYAVSLRFSIQDLEAALHYFVGHQDNPAIDFYEYFTGLTGDLYFRHPRQRIYGFSFNYFVAPLNGVFRGEGALTDEMHLMEINYLDPTQESFLNCIASRKVYQVMLGFDKDLHPKWIGTTSALTSAFEVYWKHVHRWNDDATVHPFNKDDTGIITCMFLTDYHHGTIKPLIMAMYDTEGTAMTRASVKYDPDGKWLFEVTQMSFWGNHDATSDFSYGGALISNSELSFRVSYRF